MARDPQPLPEATARAKATPEPEPRVLPEDRRTDRADPQIEKVEVNAEILGAKLGATAATKEGSGLNRVAALLISSIAGAILALVAVAVCTAAGAPDLVKLIVPLALLVITPIVAFIALGRGMGT